MKFRTLIVSATVSCLLSACAGAPTGVSKPADVLDKPPSAIERARRDAVRATFEQQFANGMTQRFSGTATSATVTNGMPTSIVVGEGAHMNVELVKGTHPQFTISMVDGNATRTLHALQPGSGGGDNGGGNGGSDAGTPAPVPTAPPNLTACKAAGGAAWANASGQKGCLGSGDSLPMSCGATWTWYAPGKGRLISYPSSGVTEILEGSYATDSLDGRCGIG